MNRIISLCFTLLVLVAACKSDKTAVSGSKHKQISLFPYFDSTESKWGYIDPKGTVVISSRFDYAARFSEGRARIGMDGLFGFIDTSGQLIVRPQFLRASDYANGRARVRADANQSRYYLDLDGIAVIPPDSNRNDAKDFSDGMAAVMIAGKWGYIDTTGKQVIPPTYSAPGRFQNGMCNVKLVESWGLIDKQGNWLIPAKYSWLDNMDEDLIRARMRDKGPPIWVFIDLHDQVVLKLPEYEEVWSFSEGLAHVKRKGKWGFIDKRGKLVIEPAFEAATGFSEGFAAVKSDSLWGYIDKKGKLTIEPRFTLADPFMGGLAYVNLGKRWGYIDKTGKVIWRSNEFGDMPGQFDAN